MTVVTVLLAEKRPAYFNENLCKRINDRDAQDIRHGIKWLHSICKAASCYEFASFAVRCAHFKDFVVILYVWLIFYK